MPARPHSSAAASSTRPAPIRCVGQRRKPLPVQVVTTFFTILLAGLFLAEPAAAQKPAITVITTPDVEAYAQTLEGIREQFPEVQVLDARDETRLREQLSKKLPALAIAIGSGAGAALERAA